ncbi:MAG: peptidoglycan D,D-transpeptidase FtsI family protein [Desulfosudaceae bacterium]
MRYSRKKTGASSLNHRIILVGVVFSLMYLVIAGRAVYLQVICDDMLAGKASREYQRTYVTTGKRGSILDRNLTEMAVTIDAFSIGARPELIKDKTARAAQLAGALGMKRAEVERRLNSRHTFVWLKRTASKEEVTAVKQLGLTKKQIEYVPEHKRVYPHKSMAAQVIGFTGTDGSGLEGLEYAFNRNLAGSSINRTVLLDAKRHGFDPGEATAGDQSCDGNNLILTLDKTIQCLTEDALAKAVIESEANSGMAIVMKPETGAILAMANVPFYNPNNFRDYNRSVYRNRAVADSFEPGSIMKIFLAAGSIDSGMCESDTVFFCEKGQYRIQNNLIHDSNPYGLLTLHEIIKYSSNIGAVKISERIGKQQLWKTLHRFGFNNKTGISCPGGTSGRLSFYQQWTEVDTGSIAFGQGISASAIQLVTAVSAIANGGLLVKPYIVDRIESPDGRTILKREREIVRRVISPATARSIADMMEAVTKPDGTGVNASIKGYTVCGKTGTAQKLSKAGKYTNEDYIASFIGFAPKENPELAVLVVVDAPRSRYYGGIVAAPAFRKIVQDSLNYLGVVPESEPGRESDEQNDKNGMMVSIQKEVSG